MKAAQTLFPALCKGVGLPIPIPEYKFAPPRKWRLDWAFVDAKLAIEVQGGLFVQGRHTRGAALLREYEKLNALACAGWRVLFVTPKEMSSGAVFDLLKKALA